MATKLWLEKQARLETYRQNPIFRFIATPPALIYEALLSFRNALYDHRMIKTRALPGKVLSVGNLIAGGTGKSPLVGLIAAELTRMGKSAAILTRGYGVKIGNQNTLVILGGKIVSQRSSTSYKGPIPDEPAMLSCQHPNVPILCGPDRLAGAKWFIRTHADRPVTHWILDDGFQHRRIERDRDILVMDFDAPFGNGWCLPRGTLREAGGNLVRAGTFVLTGQGASSKGPAPVGTLRPTFAMVPASAVLEPLNSLAEDVDTKALPTRPATLVTSIARPERVLNTATQLLGSDKLKLIAGPDHGAIDVATIAAQADAESVIITTEKDYWRQPETWKSCPTPAFVLKLEWSIDREFWENVMF